MKLSALLHEANIPASPPSDPIVSSVTHDSRQVSVGAVFVAMPGIPMAGRATLDGHDFIPAALENGAAVIVGSKPLESIGLALNVPYIQVAHPRAALADLSSAIHGHPGRKLSLLGVTGSKGKTTTAVLLHHLLEASGVWAGRVSTIGGRFRGQDFMLPGHFTTPEAPQVFETLARFVREGGTHAVLEVSSHALELDRVRGLQFDVGVWTNFSGDDHVDFHGSERAYLNAKRTLLERSSVAVLNRDDSSYAALRNDFAHVAYSLERHGSQPDVLEWRAEDVRESADGLRFTVNAPGWGFAAFVPMIGGFNASNAMAALMAAATVLFKRGWSNARVAEALQRGLKSFPGVPGRMQMLQTAPFRVINDFAHTGASLRAALETLRTTTQGRLILVIGAAGQRDPARRTGIGEAAARGADVTIFTEEDHRTEPLEEILDAMREAYLGAGGDEGNLEVITDRREAIRRAVKLARVGDTVLLAGKGHERTLERGTEFLPWDENAQARAALIRNQESGIRNR
jgi:UDP-N-acetylmuramoyl-L-alanyl-D-glutamate--2,6-diaminopimelate ligase